MGLPTQPIDYLLRGHRRAPDAIALAGPDAPLRYAQLVAQVEALAVAFQAFDSTSGGRIGICARNTTDHLVAMLATYAAGKTWVPLNPRNGRAELDAMIASTSPALIVADESCLDRFTPPSSPVPVIVGSAHRDHAGPTVRGLIDQHAGRRPTTVARADEDSQIIKFSGGSTGTPKAVVQSLRCVDAQARGILDFFELDAADVNLIASPLTHGASCFVLPVLAAGGRHVLIEHPKPAAVLDAMEAYAVTTLYAPPTLIYAMLDDPTVAGRRFPALKHLIYSAAPMTAARIRQAQRVFGPVVETAYGQVEAPQIVTAMRASELMRDEHIASVGRPTPAARVAILNPDRLPVPTGIVGEIVVQGPLVMSGYLGQPELTAATIIDGWLHTGDLGMMDQGGYVYLRGRLREVINTGGFKVFPGDVEAALARHPAVAECCVFGVEDAKWGEAVHAAVVLMPGANATAAELTDYVKAALDSVKAPKRIVIVDALPRNAAGKVSRADVRRAI